MVNTIQGQTGAFFSILISAMMNDDDDLNEPERQPHAATSRERSFHFESQLPGMEDSVVTQALLTCRAFCGVIFTFPGEGSAQKHVRPAYDEYTGRNTYLFLGRNSSRL
jgi:hypothetical protein